ncbi:GTPase-activating protein S23, partial [Conglomerata obtusa]
MEETILQIEQKDGIRCIFNIFPTRPMDILPLSILYNPNTTIPSTCDYEPVFCFTCRSILNPFSEINYGNKSWTCVFCKKVSHLPEYYRDIQPEYLPLEMHDTTVEYVLSKDASYPPIFVLLIDVCTFDDERHLLLQEAVKTTLENLPQDCLVSIIQF